MTTVDAVYEGGVFRPVTTVSLPEGTSVVVRLPAGDDALQEPTHSAASAMRVHEILRSGAETGISDLAARHNEHQP